MAAAGCTLLLASCSSTRHLIDRSDELAAQKNYYQAYWMIANARDSYPQDPELERVFWERRRDYLLSQGRELLFNEQEHAAIEKFEMVFAIEPGSRAAQGWIMRAKTKLAEREVRQGDLMRFERRLEEALKAYNKALGYVPEFPTALHGIAEVTKLFDKMSQKAVEQYKLASRARGEYPPSYKRSSYHSGLAVEMDKSLAKAKALRDSSTRRIADDLVDRAEKSEAEGFYAAALTDYRAIKVLIPEFEEIDATIERLQKEVAARSKCRDAEMMIRKKHFDKADVLLSEAFEEAVSGDVKALVSDVMKTSREHRYKDAFLKARDQELDWQLEDALTAYEAIDKEFANDYEKDDKEGFEGVRVRILQVKNTLAEARDAYAQGQKAEKAGKLKEAADHYSEAVAVYPGYKGLEAKVKSLREKAK